MIKEIIVVEGKDDTAAVKRAVEAETIETGGSALSKETLRRIELAQKRRGVIVLTDPDHSGERLRRIISERVPGCKHAFLNREEAMRGGEIGVEHASADAIRRALSDVKTESSPAEPEVSWRHLVEAGLVAHPQAASRRLEVGRRLGIGYANGKQFYKRCAMFRITLAEFQRATAGLDEAEQTKEG